MSMAWPKLLIILLHISASVIAGWLLWQVLHKLKDQKVVCRYHSRKLAKQAFLMLCWNAAMAIVAISLFDGLRLTPAGMLLWPAIVIYFVCEIVLDWRTLREDA